MSFIGYTNLKLMPLLRYINKFSNSITAFATLLSLIYIVYSTNKNLSLVARTIELANEQINIQRKSFPAQFSMSYRNINEFNEQPYITNTGNTLLRTVTAEYVYYFISQDDKVVSSDELVHFVRANPVLQKKLIDAGLISKPEDIIGLLGTHRLFDIAYLEPNRETLVEVSSSSVQNANRIGNLMGYESFVRWKIRYNEELTNKKVERLVYIWLNGNGDSSLSGRPNLKDVVGGEGIIGIIDKYEENSKQLIFGSV